MTPAFDLDPRLAADTLPIGEGPLSRILLMNDAQYPWVILVPRRTGLREIYELDDADRRLLADESLRLGQRLMQHFAGTKLNVAALGNIVSQLHVHHVVRYEGDPAWPAPVWGRLPPKRYETAVAEQRLTELRGLLLE